MTAVTIKSNKTDSNEAKENEGPLEPSYRKKINRIFGKQNYIYNYKYIYNFARAHALELYIPNYMYNYIW